MYVWRVFRLRLSTCKICNQIRHNICSNKLDEIRHSSRKESKMFDNVFESLRKATEETVHLQQEMLKKWVSFWPEFPSATGPWAGQVQQFQKKWAQTVNDLLKRQRETAEAQFEAGLKNIDKAFRLYDVKNAEELRTKTSELWQQCFNSLRQAFEAQLRDCQTAMVKCVELMTKTAA